MGNILISPNDAKQKKIDIQNDPLACFSLEYEASVAASHGPYSVTFHKSPAASGNPHDYFSEGRYWWPNPQDPDGPYIRRDGMSNPNNFRHHRTDIAAMSRESLVMAMAAYYLDKPTTPNGLGSCFTLGL